VSTSRRLGKSVVADCRSSSLAILENVKKTYGVHACLLPLNSASSAEPHESGISALWRTALRHPPRSPPPRPPGDAAPPPVPPKEPEDDGPSAGAAAEAEEEPAASDFALLFNDTDVKRLQMFVREFAAQSLVPFLERCTTQWNETVSRHTWRQPGHCSSSTACGVAARPDWPPLWRRTQAVWLERQQSAWLERHCCALFLYSWLVRIQL
jgi:hypothetical protein